MFSTQMAHAGEITCEGKLLIAKAANGEMIFDGVSYKELKNSVPAGSELLEVGDGYSLVSNLYFATPSKTENAAEANVVPYLRLTNLTVITSLKSTDVSTILVSIGEIPQKNTMTKSKTYRCN